MNKTFNTTSFEQTLLLGEKLGKLLNAHDIITLTGNLGVGKTTLTGGIAKGLGIKDVVISPTFNILKCYFAGRLPLYHIDAYRLENNQTDIGLDEFIEGNGVAIIEWPQYIKELLKIPHLEITIKNLGDNNREINLISPNSYYDKILEDLQL